MGMNLTEVYRHRFSDTDIAQMRVVWGVLVREFFQQFVRTDADVLDLGAGYCHFINAIAARRKVAFDANPGVRGHARPDVEVVISDDLTLPMFGDHELDHVFMSNFLEHLSSPRAVLEVLTTLRTKLRPQGSLLILQPNFRYVGPAYFDFIDHKVVLTEKSLAEALELTGFRISYMKKRFLPYTSKSRLPRAKALVRLYLRLPVLHQIFGQQTFVEAKPRP